jgi:steroid 5-alpha reductase family enzyme
MTDPSLSYSDRSSFGDLLAWWSWPSGPHRTSLLICHAVALLTFVVSTITGDLSQVDRLWSMLPAVYAWTCVVDARTTLAACLATAWSVRLTYNFYRRGGYGSWPRPWRGDEDYRWGTLRSGSLGGRWWTLLTNGWIMTIFNFVFISFFQNYLLLYIASPSLVAWSMATVATPPSLNIVDAIASVLFVVSLIGETVADNQQRAFQKGKEAWRLRNSRRTDDAGLADAGDASSSVERQYEDGFCEFL